jgi:aspartyl-tRNA(Asn)/glutamyl-tRNA(Gln) amidotransferase subunit A
MNIDLKNLTITKARQGLLEGQFSAKDLARSYLEEIKKLDSNVHAYLEVFGDVLEQAEEADKKLSRYKNSQEEPPLLLGIPLAIKDNILIKDRRAGSASKILEGYIAPYDATVIKKLKESGAVFIGRTNMDEFAMGSSTENSAYGPTKNPLSLDRVPGGSSGGSAAAVAGNMSLASLGSDTGGSIRQPAAFCGIVGFKPSYGAVSRYGLMAMGSSLDVIGPLTKTVEDAEMVFSVIRGEDKMDATSLDIHKDFKQSIYRIADLSDFVTSFGVSGVDDEILQNYREALDICRSKGFEVKKIKTDLTPLKYALAVYYIIMPAEVSTNLARFDGVKFGLRQSGGNLLEEYFNTRGIGLGREARRRILLGTYVLSSGYYDAYYSKANQVRGLIKKTFEKIFEEVDIVATPTTPTVAFKFGEKTSNPVEMYLADIFTVTANIAGIPAISIPSGIAKRNGIGLPIGMQFMSAYGTDFSLLNFGKKFEKR